MELIVESDGGRVLGSCDLDFTRWELVGDHFENLRSITVTITAAGKFGNMYIKIGNKRMNGSYGPQYGYLGLGFRVRVMARSFKLTPSF